MYAHWATETGGPNGNFYNWNIGNVKYVPSAGGVPFVVLKGVWEEIGGKKVYLPSNDPGARFRAFNSLEEGMEFYLKLLKNSRYASSWKYIESGDVAGFAHALKVKGYYTAKEKDYAAALQTNYNSFLGKKDKQKEQSSSFDITDLIKKIQAFFKYLTGSPKTALSKMANDPNNYIIVISSTYDYSSAVEYARIFALALEENIDAKTKICTDGTDVEINCKINGDPDLVVSAVSQFGNVISDEFNKSAKNIDPIRVFNAVMADTNSTYAPITLKALERNSRIFQLKVSGKNNG